MRDDGGREADRLQRESTVLLLASIAIVVFGTFEVLEPSALSSSLDRAARGSIVFGLLAFGGAGLSLLGMAPKAPPAAGSRGLEKCREIFFGAVQETEPGEEAVPGREFSIQAGNQLRRIRLGWARMAMSLGVFLFLLASLLTLTAYSAAVLMALAGTAGVLVLRST